MTDFRTFEFHPAFCNLNTITTHTASGGTNRDSIFINCKVIFIDRGSSTFSIKVDKWCDILAFEVLIIRHGIMGRIPADITIRLGKVTVTFAVSNAILFAFTDTLFPFPV